MLRNGPVRDHDRLDVELRDLSTQSPEVAVWLRKEMVEHGRRHANAGVASPITAVPVATRSTPRWLHIRANTEKGFGGQLNADQFTPRSGCRPTSPPGSQVGGRIRVAGDPLPPSNSSGHHVEHGMILRTDRDSSGRYSCGTRLSPAIHLREHLARTVSGRAIQPAPTSRRHLPARLSRTVLRPCPSTPARTVSTVPAGPHRACARRTPHRR
jgi:hypothetical protein